MAGRAGPAGSAEMPAALADWLRVGRAVQLLTVDPDGYAHAVFTWGLAMDACTVRFGVDTGSATFANLERTGQASLELAGDSLLFIIKGTARLLAGQMRSAPFGYALFSLQVISVRDQSWNGVRVEPFNYYWPPEQRHAMEQVQEAVLKEMREYVPGAG